MVKEYIVKDGNTFRTFKIKIDVNKPKVYRDGYQYKFNTEFLSSTATESCQRGNEYVC